MKETDKKPRGDARLKTLPAERQAAVYEHAQEHTLTETVKWLREDGVTTSRSALCVFLSWYALRMQFEQDEATTDGLIEQLKAEVPNLSEEQLDELGQRTFSLLAIRRQDVDAFVKVRSARFKGLIEVEKLKLRQQAETRLNSSLELQRKKFQRETAELYLKWSEDQRARQVVSEGGKSQSEKIEALGQLMFGEDWAASSKLQAPSSRETSNIKPQTSKS